MPKKELKPVEAHEVEDVVSLIDEMFEQGTSRLKVKVTKEQAPGSVSKQYHLGRCDINSPFACGTPFDLLE